MKQLLNLFLAISMITAYGQNKSGGKGTGQIHTYNPIFSDNYSRDYDRFLEKDESIKGTRFVFDDFGQKGLVFIDGVTYTAYGINIDAINNDIVTLIGKDSILVLEKNKIDSLRIENKDFKKFHGNKFYEVLSPGKKITLLKGYQGRIVEGYENVMKGTKNKDSYKISTTYFINKGSQIEKLEPSKRKILEHFEDNKDLVKDFIKKQRISTKDENDLIKLFEYYNSL